MSLRIYLIRHGETEWSRSGQHTSVTEKPLTPHGEEQARAVARRLAGVTFAHVLVSPRVRAQQTCTLAGYADRAEIFPELREWDYGEYEGLRASEVLEKRPGWDIYRDGCPGGESAEEIATRADAVVARLRTVASPTAIFSHGHFLRVLAVRWVGLPITHARLFALGTASISAIGFLEDHALRPRILSWNEEPSEEHP